MEEAVDAEEETAAEAAEDVVSSVAVAIASVVDVAVVGVMALPSTSRTRTLSPAWEGHSFISLLAATENTEASHSDEKLADYSAGRKGGGYIITSLTSVTMETICDFSFLFFPFLFTSFSLHLRAGGPEVFEEET